MTASAGTGSSPASSRSNDRLAPRVPEPRPRRPPPGPLHEAPQADASLLLDDLAQEAPQAIDLDGEWIGRRHSTSGRWFPAPSRNVRSTASQRIEPTADRTFVS